MKKIILLGLLIASLNVFPQENVIKAGVLGVAFGDLSLGYERVITPSTSINFNAGYWDLKMSPVDLKSYFDEGEGVWLNEIRNGWNASLEYRFYLGKQEALKGLYLAPYLRYWNNSFVFNDYIPSNNINELFDVRTKISGWGLGFQMGYQWLINDKISIDWYFFGASVERVFLNASYVIASNRNFSYQTIVGDVRDVFSGFNLLEKNLVTRPDADRLKIELPILSPGIRTGLTIGYAF